MAPSTVITALAAVSVVLLVGILGVILWVYRESLESGSIFKDPSEPAGRNGKPHQLSLAELGRSHIFAPGLPESLGSRTIVHLR
jgi:hypothetical protein